METSSPLLRSIPIAYRKRNLSCCLLHYNTPPERKTKARKSFVPMKILMRISGRSSEHRASLHIFIAHHNFVAGEKTCTWDTRVVPRLLYSGDECLLSCLPRYWQKHKSQGEVLGDCWKRSLILSDSPSHWNVKEFSNVLESFPLRNMDKKIGKSFFALVNVSRGFAKQVFNLATRKPNFVVVRAFLSFFCDSAIG